MPRIGHVSTVGAVFGPVWWASRLYALHIRVWTLSLPIAALRAGWVLVDDPPTIPAFLAEVIVEGLRIVQAAAAIAAAKGVRLRDLRQAETWRPREAAEFRWPAAMLGLVGYALTFGAANLLIAWMAGTAAGGPPMTDTVAYGHAHSAVSLALKNLFVIPVSVLTLLRIFRLVP